jgi:predicted permease
MIPIAFAIAAATAAGFAAEHRWRQGAERLAARVIKAMLFVLLPPLVFLNIVRLDPSGEIAAGLGFGLLALAATLGAGYAIGTYVLRLPRPAVGALMLAAGFANTTYLGLPLTTALFGTDELPNAIVYDLIVSTLAMFTVGVSVAAVFGNVASHPHERVKAILVRNPPLWACILGLLAPASFAPGWAIDTSHVIVYALLPLGFFVLGVTLAAEAEDGEVRFPPPFTAPVAAAIGLRMVVAPAVVLLLSLALIGVPDSFISQAAMASGVNSLLVAHQFGLDRGLIASAIAWSTTIVVAAGLLVSLL